MVVTKKWVQRLTINNDLCEKFYGVKTMHLLECRCISSAGRKQTRCAVAHFFQVVKHCWYFLIVFSSRYCLYIKRRFFIKCWNVFWLCSCGNRYSLQSLKGKILLRINRSWVQNFPKYKSKCSDQNTKVVRFYPWKMYPWNSLILSKANDRIEIDNSCCLVLCSKRL